MYKVESLTFYPNSPLFKSRLMVPPSTQVLKHKHSTYAQLLPLVLSLNMSQVRLLETCPYTMSHRLLQQFPDWSALLSLCLPSNARFRNIKYSNAHGINHLLRSLPTNAVVHLEKVRLFFLKQPPQSYSHDCFHNCSSYKQIATTLAPHCTSISLSRLLVDWSLLLECIFQTSQHLHHHQVTLTCMLPQRLLSSIAVIILDTHTVFSVQLSKDRVVICFPVPLQNVST